MRLREPLLSLLPVVLLSGCVGAWKYTPTTSATASARPADCQLELFSTPPQRPYEELGVLEPSPSVARSAEDFLKEIRPSACAAGGDAVLAFVNDRGTYIRGTVLRYRATTSDAGAQ